MFSVGTCIQHYLNGLKYFATTFITPYDRKVYLLLVKHRVGSSPKTENGEHIDIMENIPILQYLQCVINKILQSYKVIDTKCMHTYIYTHSLYHIMYMIYNVAILGCLWIIHCVEQDPLCRCRCERHITTHVNTTSIQPLKRWTIMRKKYSLRKHPTNIH